MARVTGAGRFVAVLMAATVVGALGPRLAQGQTPQPFPRPSAPREGAPAPAPTTPPMPTPETDQTPTGPGNSGNNAQQPAIPAPADGAPTEAMLGLPIYPGAQYLTSYDAGRGQRFYLFGTRSAFGDIVTYYRNILKVKGDLVFDLPPTHAFEVGRFREETMAFPPGVTVKDFASGGSQGFPNPVSGAEPAHFPTIIQIVPLPGTVR